MFLFTLNLSFNIEKQDFIILGYIFSDEQLFLWFYLLVFMLLQLVLLQVALLKFTGYKLLNNVSDTGKAFLIILITDIFLG